MTLHRHSLLDELACVVPEHGGYEAPRARISVEDAAPAPFPEEPAKRPGPKPGTPRPPRKPKPSAPPPKVKHVAHHRILIVLHAIGPATSNEIALGMIRRGWRRTRGAVDYVLVRMRRLGLVERATLTSDRDINRAGSRYLWSAR